MARLLLLDPFGVITDRISVLQFISIASNIGTSALKRFLVHYLVKRNQFMTHAIKYLTFPKSFERQVLGILVR